MAVLVAAVQVVIQVGDTAIPLGEWRRAVLEAIGQVRPGITGLNPDEPESSEKAWLQARIPPKTPAGEAGSLELALR